MMLRNVVHMEIASFQDPAVSTFNQTARFLWERPPEIAGPIKGILLLCHGCHHAATDFWIQSQSCPQCLGLPIETGIVASALNRGWVVLAVSSLDRIRGCWTQADLFGLAKAISVVRQKLPECRNAVDACPVAAIGASSGGRIVSVLDESRLVGILGVVVQIMTSGKRVGTDESPHQNNNLPMRFVHMSRDTRRAQAIRRQVHELTRRGVDVKEFPVYPRPLSALNFSEPRGIQVAGQAKDILRGRPAVPSKLIAEKLIKSLRYHNHIDSSGYLLKDPAISDWRGIARAIIPESVDTFKKDQSPISEVLREAWAFHEFTDEHLKECLLWFESLLMTRRRSGA